MIILKIEKKLKIKLIIQVFRKTKKKYNNDELENIICPECKDLTFININGDNININGCINKHKKAYTINEFMKMQYIDEKEIKCDRCKNNKYLYNDNFYICSCKLKFCQLCFYKHKKKEGHNLIYFNKRYSICKKHISEFISYCTICNRNLCEKCEEEDINHKNNIIIFKKEKPNDKNIKEKKKEIIENIFKIKKYKIHINLVTKLFNNFILNLNEDIDNYIKIYNKMNILLDNMNNYENIRNILDFNIENIDKNLSIDNLNNFLDENINYKISYLVEKFNDYLNRICMIYKIPKYQAHIRLFGKDFVKKYKDKYYLYIENKIIDLCEFYYNKEYDSRLNIFKKSKKLKIILLGNNNISNMSYMFSGCSTLLSLPDISKWNTNNTTDMSNMFSGCSSLSSGILIILLI